VEPVVEPVVELPPVYRRVIETRLSLVDEVAGQETLPPAERLERVWRFQRIVSVTDEELPVGFGGVRPGISRTFDALRSWMKSDPSGDGTHLRTSDLEGRTVLFEWDPARGRYGARGSDEDERGEPLARAVLEDLEGDMTLGGLEPPTAPATSLEPERLVALFGLGGGLFVTDEEDALASTQLTSEEALQAPIVTSLEALLLEGHLVREKSQLRVTRAKPLAGDGRTLGLEELELGGQLVLRSRPAKTLTTLDLSGRYTWDPARRDVRSLALDFDLECEWIPDPAHRLLVLAGTGRVTVEVEALEPGAESPEPAVRVDRVRGGGASYIAARADHVCGVDHPRAISNPARVDYDTLLEATEEVKELESRHLDPGSSRGTRLMAKARLEVTAACEAVRFDGQYCSIWKQVRRRDGAPVDDVTGQVLAVLAGNDGE